jgi:hypothetical protein
VGLADTYKTFHPTAAECKIFSTVHIFSRIDHVVSHRKVSANFENGNHVENLY